MSEVEVVPSDRQAESGAKHGSHVPPVRLSALCGLPIDLRNFVVPLLIVFFWQAATSLGLAPDFILPTPLKVVSSWWHWIFVSGPGIYDGKWLVSASTTAQRVAIGFLIASTSGVVLGILIGYFRSLYAFLDPPIQLFRPIPTVAWVPLSVVFFGFNAKASIFLIAYGSFFPVVLNATAGVLRSQQVFVRVGRMLGANRLEMLWYIVMPAALPSIFTGLRLGVAVAWILAIVGEMVAAHSGLGYDLLNSYTVFRYDIVIAAMLSFAVLGFLSDRVVILLEKRVLRWRVGYDVDSR
jgi:NitT/TauT family transport system permease protein